MPSTRVSKRMIGAHCKRSLERGWQKGLAKGLTKGWRRVGTRLAKGRGVGKGWQFPKRPFRRAGLWLHRVWTTESFSAVKQRGRKMKQPPEIIQKLHLRKWPISSADFPYDSYGKNRAPFLPFLGEGFWGNIRRPLLLPAPLFYCWVSRTFHRAGGGGMALSSCSGHRPRGWKPWSCSRESLVSSISPVFHSTIWLGFGM